MDLQDLKTKESSHAKDFKFEGFTIRSGSTSS